MSNAGYSEAEQFRQCEAVIEEAKICQMMMGERTAKFVKAPTMNEIMAEYKENEARLKECHR